MIYNKEGKASESILLSGDDICHSLCFASHVHIPYLSGGSMSNEFVSSPSRQIYVGDGMIARYTVQEIWS
jgi:hypothetical protein